MKSNLALRKHGLRRCVTCGKVKPLNAENFMKCGISSTGRQQYRNECAECRQINSDKNERNKCMICDDLEECKAVMGVMVLVDETIGLYEPHPLPCYEMEKV